MVDLPEPLSPTMPKHSPGATLKLTPFTTSVSPNAMRRLLRIILLLSRGGSSAVMRFSMLRHAPALAVCPEDVSATADIPAARGCKDVELSVNYRLVTFRRYARRT